MCLSVCRVNANPTDTDHTLATAQLDSHADTCCFGPNAKIVHYTGMSVNVNAFVSTVGSVKNVPIVTVAVAYDCPITFVTYILFFHQVLHFKDLNDHLLCPAQLRYNGITVNDTPLRDLPPHQRTPDQHSILEHSPASPLHIILKLQGTTSYFDTRTPTDSEIESEDTCVHKHMTMDTHWEPHNESFAQEEEILRASHMPADPTISAFHTVTKPEPILRDLHPLPVLDIFLLLPLLLPRDLLQQLMLTAMPHCLMSLLQQPVSERVAWTTSLWPDDGE